MKERIYFLGHIAAQFELQIEVRNYIDLFEDEFSWNKKIVLMEILGIVFTKNVRFLVWFKAKLSSLKSVKVNVWYWISIFNNRVDSKYL